MSEPIRLGGSSILPPVVKNLLILNVLFFLAKFVLQRYGIDLDHLLGLHYYKASDFHFWQPLTYMFMHGDFGHIFFNMFALWMFGAMIENQWGSKRFLIYYLVAGIGAGITHYVVLSFMLHPSLVLIDGYLANPNMDTLQALLAGHQFYLHSGSPEWSALQSALAQLNADPYNVQSLNQVTTLISEYRDLFLNAHNVIGASGAVFGVLLAFGMMFPNSVIYLYFLIPIKAKWFVAFYGVVELVYGVLGSSDGVAHFAHLGGMLFGLILILIWRKHDKRNRRDEWYYYDE